MEPDLADRLFALAAEHQPAATVQDGRARFDALAYEADALAINFPDPAARLHAFTRWLFDEQRFGPDAATQQSDAFYLPTVLARRRGSCAGLSLMTIALGRRVGLPLQLVAVPGHVWVRYDDGHLKQDFDPTTGGRLQPAARVRGRVLDEDGLVAYALTQHALTLAAAGRPTAAMVEEAVRRDPSNAMARYLRATVAAQRRAWAEAEADASEALRLDPSFGEAWSLRSLVRAREGRYPEAILDGQRACGLLPGRPAIAQRLAAVYEAAGDAHRAQQTQAQAAALRRRIEERTDGSAARPGQEGT